MGIYSQLHRSLYRVTKAAQKSDEKEDGKLEEKEWKIIIKKYTMHFICCIIYRVRYIIGVDCIHKTSNLVHYFKRNSYFKRRIQHVFSMERN